MTVGTSGCTQGGGGGGDEAMVTVCVPLAAPLATAHSNPLWARTCVGRVNGAPG